MDFTNLPQYVERENGELIKRTVLGAKTLGYINVQADVKGAAAINLVDADAELQAGGCGFNAQGGARLSERVINTKLLKVNQSFCDKDFINYYTSYAVKVGVGKEVLPFEEYFTSIIVDKVKEKVEKMVWTGADTSTEFKGLLPILAEESDVITVTPSEGTSAYSAIKEVYAAIPENILDKAVIFVGADTYRTFIMEMVEKNFYHYDGGSVEAKEFILPATSTKVVAVNGLNGTKKIVAGDPANFFYGCDMMNDAETFDLWYSQDNREFRLAIQFNGGTQVAFPNEVVVAQMA